MIETIKLIREYATENTENQNNQIEIIELDSRFQFIKEYENDFYIEHTLFDGRKVQQYLYSELTFEIDYSALIEKENILKLQEILQYERAGNTIVLQPHKDAPRSFKVFSSHESRGLGLHYGGYYAAGNKEYSIKFKTSEPVTNPLYSDLDLLTNINMNNF